MKSTHIVHIRKLLTYCSMLHTVRFLLVLTHSVKSPMFNLKKNFRITIREDALPADLSKVIIFIDFIMLIDLNYVQG